MIRVVLGVAILMTLFGALFAAMVRAAGWREALAIFGRGAAVVGTVTLATWLIGGGE